MGFVRRLSLVTAFVTATTIAIAPAAQAVPDTIGQHRLTFYFVDGEGGLGSPCAVGLTMSSHVKPIVGSGAEEWGFIDVDPTSLSCSGVMWTGRITIVDQAPPHPVRAVSAEDDGATAFALTRQLVPYGIGVREAGVITFQFEAVSRLGRICMLDVWHMNAVTWTAAPAGPPTACVA